MYGIFTGRSISSVSYPVRKVLRAPAEKGITIGLTGDGVHPILPKIPVGLVHGGKVATFRPTLNGDLAGWEWVAGEVLIVTWGHGRRRPFKSVSTETWHGERLDPPL